jgi:hypothetical protein
LRGSRFPELAKFYFIAAKLSPVRMPYSSHLGKIPFPCFFFVS